MINCRSIYLVVSWVSHCIPLYSVEIVHFISAHLSLWWFYHHCSISPWNQPTYFILFITHFQANNKGLIVNPQHPSYLFKTSPAWVDRAQEPILPRLILDGFTDHLHDMVQESRMEGRWAYGWKLCARSVYTYTLYTCTTLISTHYTYVTYMSVCIDKCNV